MTKNEAREEGLVFIQKLRRMGFDVTLCHDAKLKTYYIDIYEVVKSMATFPYEDEESNDE